MMKLFDAFIMCQSMFCALPCPIQRWREEARDWMLVFLPIVGLEMGAIWYGIYFLCQYLKLPVLAQALTLSSYPFFVTGFLHLDGFMDVTDAMKSCRSLERRREILKDSHVGSFSVIAVVFLILAQFVFFASAKNIDGRVLLLIPVISRCGSALAVFTLKPMSTSQYVNRKKSKIHIGMIVGIAASAFILAFFSEKRNAFILVAGALVYCYQLQKSYRSLEGMNGDISGYCLTWCELGCIAAMALL